MTVCELMAELASLPMHARVVLLMGLNELANGRECTAARRETASKGKGGGEFKDNADFHDPEFDEPLETVINLI